MAALANRARLKAASQAAFFMAGIALVAVGVGMIYLPLGVITLGLLAVAAGGYVRGGDR